MNYTNGTLLAIILAEGSNNCIVQGEIMKDLTMLLITIYVLSVLFAGAAGLLSSKSDQLPIGPTKSYIIPERVFD